MPPSIITIPGQALQSGFCVYVQEVLHDENSLGYYVGMTGDNHYPSARSPFHRLAGHFDRAARSTQRQLGRAIDALLTTHGLDLSDLTLRMHYYPISGFEPIKEASNKKGSANYFKLPQFAAKLLAYRNRRREVLTLENHIIWLFHQGSLNILNKTGGAENVFDDEEELMEIVDTVSATFAL
jgi:hypothetical protein